MSEKKQQEKNPETMEDDKRGFIEWIKEHKGQLALIGVSGTALIAMVLGLKKKDTLMALWDSLKKNIEKGKPLSAKWYEKADLKELEEVREQAQKTFLNPEVGLETKSFIWDHVFPNIDNAIGKREWSGKAYGYPVKSEHGWHLPSD